MNFTKIVLDTGTFVPVTKNNKGGYVYRKGTSLTDPRLVIETRLPTVKEPAARVNANLQTYSRQECQTSCDVKVADRTMFSLKIVTDLNANADERSADLADFRAFVNSNEFSEFFAGDVIYT